MDKARIGVIGVGSMGRKHCSCLTNGEIPNAKLTAIRYTRAESLDWAQANLPNSVSLYDSDHAFFNSGKMDGVIVAAQHYFHPPLVKKAIDHGYHVLCEKPAGVYTKHVRKMNEAADRSGSVFGLVFDWRTWPIYQKVKELIDNHEIGELKSNVFITTDWYRPQSYYDSGGWRATWAGEGGGILLNQASHHIDLWQWICGLPSRVRSICNFSKYHDIEVEDDVVIYADYPGGATGVFITSTGLTPGTTRWEITGNEGKIVVENGKISLWRLSIPERQFNREYRGFKAKPESAFIEVPYSQETPSKFKGIISNWIEAIISGTDNVPLLAPGSEGIKSLEIINAAYLSSWEDRQVEIPVDEDVYLQKLREKIDTTGKKSPAFDGSMVQ